VIDRVPAGERARLEQAVAACRPDVISEVRGTRAAVAV
jgi:hypothetical protein